MIKKNGNGDGFNSFGMHLVFGVALTTRAIAISIQTLDQQVDPSSKKL